VTAVTAAATSTAILLLGMHRSGTSATTRVLNLLGAELGPNLLEPQPDNRKGFWEHQDAVQIHERLLSALGLEWHDLRELPPGWLEHPASLKATEEIVELIRRDFSGVQLWAVKDPRICRLAPLWIQALDQLGIRATALIVVRDPREVAASLHVRDGWSYGHSWLMWAQHVLESTKATEHIPRAMLNYDDLMKDWASNMARIGGELGISWPRSIVDARSSIEVFLNPADRHHQAGKVITGDMEGQRPPQWIVRLMDICSAVVSRREDWSSIAALHCDYLVHAELFAGPIAELAGERKALEKIALERMEVIEQVQREIAAHSAALQGAATALSAKSSEHEELSRRYDELHQSLNAKSRELDLLSHQYRDLHQAFETQSGAMGALASQLESLKQLHEGQSIRYSLLEESFHAQRLEQMRIEASAADVLRAKLQLEEQLKRAHAITRSRRWLLRRIAQLTFRQSTVSDVDFR
jgi:hypothetical protein